VSCISCGNAYSASIKHLPLPEGRNGWIELSEWSEYCADCAEKEAIKIDEICRKAKRGKINDYQ
jgi:hypothetical protein